MTSLRGWLPCLGWMLVAVGATFIATLRVDPSAGQISLALAAGVFVFLVHLPGFRSRPLARAAGVPLVAGALAAGLSLGASI